MNLLFWKHKKDARVIKKQCYDKLPSTVQNHYHPTEEAPTHHFDDSTGSIITGVLIGELLADQSAAPAPASDTPSFEGFGGGDFGGGGSSDSFDTPDSGGSSYDSGSSYNSSSSYDSGSSSSDY